MLRARKPRRVQVTEEVPVTVYYLLKWKGWDDDGRHVAEGRELHCPELIDEYELLQRQQRGDSYDDEGETVAMRWSWDLATAVRVVPGGEGRPTAVVGSPSSASGAHPSMQQMESAAASCAAVQPAVLASAEWPAQRSAAWLVGECGEGTACSVAAGCRAVCRWTA